MQDVLFACQFFKICFENVLGSSFWHLAYILRLESLLFLCQGQICHLPHNKATVLNRKGISLIAILKTIFLYKASDVNFQTKYIYNYWNGRTISSM